MKKNKSLKLIIGFAIIIYMMFAQNTISLAGTLSSDINGINESQYPGVKSLIQKLQSSHSNYNFLVYYTRIDWTEAVTMEYQGHGSSPKNLFNESSKYTGKWFCPICGKKSYDTGWHCASVDAIKYMMDPRNSLDETSVYQFKNLEVADVSSENLQTVINSKYSGFGYINNATAINAMVTASNNYAMNGFSILAKIVNEQGKGTSPLATGSGYNGQYVGYYNFFNVGAYGSGTANVMLNGLKYAYNKGWNSVESSILGGSEYYKSQYIGRGQNTLYYQRFNVVYTTSLFSHQYQQDIMGAQTSATLLKGYYETAGTINNLTHTFVIPLYDNMPSTVSKRPSTTENSNFDIETGTVLTNKLAVRAAPNSSRIIGYLNVNEEVKILERATKVSSDGNYWDTIVSSKYGTYGYVLRSGISQSVDVPSYAFDSKYYADTYPDLKAIFGYNEANLYKHFLTSGIFEGRSSSAVLNVKYYIQNNSDIASVFKTDYVSAFYHFANSGCKELRPSASDYNGMFYKYYYADLTSLSSVQLIQHYINYGKKEGRLGGIDIGVQNILFDANVYGDLNNDVKAVVGSSKNALLQHWIRYGIKEGRTASLVYSPSAYKSLNLDLQSLYGSNNKALMMHYINYGMKEGRTASYIYSPGIYKSLNSDLQKAYGSNNISFITHFINSGMSEGRIASLVYNSATYKLLNSDLQKAYGNNTKALAIHFLNLGMKEGRQASEVFSVKCYLESNLDLKAVYGNNYKSATIHFLTYGVKEPRKSSDTFDVRVYMNNYSDLKNAFAKNYKQYYIHYLTDGKKEGRKAI